MTTVALLMVGSELLDGRVIDTNSVYIGGRLKELGLKVSKRVVCDDLIDEIVGALSFLAEESSIIVVTGGLGPTEDDLTREAVASFAGVDLIESPMALAEIKKVLAEQSISLTNLSQARLPDGARMISNPVGTAPGFSIDCSGVLIYSFPGVPLELDRMIETGLLNDLYDRKLARSTEGVQLFRFFGIRESDLSTAVRNLDLKSERIAYQVKFPEVRLLIGGREEDVSADSQLIHSAIDNRFLISCSKDIGLPEIISAKLEELDASVMLIDGFTCGYLCYLMGQGDTVARRIVPSKVIFDLENKLSIKDLNRLREDGGAEWLVMLEKCRDGSDSFLIRICSDGFELIKRIEGRYRDERLFRYAAHHALNELRLALLDC